MYCGVCGSQVPDGAAHCPNCGSKLAATVVQQQVAQEPIPAPKIQMDPIPAPNIPTDPIPAPNIPVEAIPAPNVTSEPFVPAVTDTEDEEDAAGAAAQEAAARAAQEAAARVAQEKAARAAQEAAAKAAAEEAERIAAQEAAARKAADEQAAALRAAQEAAARKAAEEQAAAQRAAQEMAAKAAAEQAATQKAAAEAAAKAAADKAAQQAAAAAAVQAAQQAAAPQAPQATPQATATPQTGNAAMPQYQMINGHYVLVPKQLQQIQQTPQGVPVPPVAPGVATQRLKADAASVLSVIALIFAIIAIGGAAAYYFLTLGKKTFIFYNLLSTISMPLYVLIGVCVFMTSKKVQRDYAAPSMAVSYALISMPLLIGLINNPTAYLRYIPNTFRLWAIQLTPILVILSLLLIIACASTMFAPKLNAVNYAHKALNVKFFSGFCGVFTFLAAASLGYYYMWDGTLRPLIDNFDYYSKDYWWLDYGSTIILYLSMIFGWLAVIAAGFVYRKKLTSR